MRIGIDARPLAWYGGVQTAAKGLVDSLARVDHRNEYLLYSDIDFPFEMAHQCWHRRVVPRTCRLSGFGLAWPFLNAARSARSEHVDAYLGLAGVVPGFLGESVRRVVVVHDVMWRICPELMRPRARWSMRVFVENSIRRADRILVDANTTKGHIETILNTPGSKISVVPLGVDSQRFSPLDRIASKSHIEQKYGIVGRYILAVGSVNPRKNLITLLKAYRLLLDRGLPGFQLVIVGVKEWKYSGVADAIQSLSIAEDSVKFLGYVKDEEMPRLYGGADVFIFPSLFEGFGLPLLEAMACGTPVVASDNSSFPEVGGDAAVYVPPRSPAKFADAIQEVLQDPALRDVMVGRGLERVKAFTWENTARGVLQALEA